VERNSTTSLKNIWFSLLILLVCCLLSFWPLTFHVFSLKNDALNYFLPVRHQVSELIYNGYWPFWSPYFNLGYPLHGDMQSGAWNPFVQIISLFGPYTLRTLQYETLLYVYLSGVGMFFLVHHFFKDWRVSLLIGASFMLCGFNSDSTQFLNWLSAASFLPLIFLFYYRTLIERSWKTALCCGLFLYLCFVTAYPADFILTCYFLLFILIWFLLKKNNSIRKTLRSQLLLHSIIAISFLLLSLPAIISYAEFLPLTERGSGANYSDVMSNPLHPGLLISYLTPLLVWKASFAWMTDPLERNSFFGLIPFAFFVLSFFTKFSQPITRFLKWAFVVSLLFSFGEIGGVRVIAYYALPLMKAFRHPANERLFTIFIACLLAAFTFRELLNDTVTTVKRKRIWYVLLIAFGVLLTWAVSNFSFALSGGQSAAQLKSWLDEMDFHDFLFINVLIQIPFLMAVYYWFVKKIKWKAVLIVALLNSCLHTFLFQPLTVVKKDEASTIQNVLDNVQVTGYPIPDLTTSLQQNSKRGMDFFKEIGTSNMYNKKIGRVDYRITPSNLLKQNEFWFNSKVRDILFQYPLFYKADTIVMASDSSKIIARQKRILLSETKVDEGFSNTSTYSVKVKKFTPLNWELDVQCNEPGFYSLFQNNYPRWQLWIDGKKEKVERCNVSFIGFKLPAGKHSVLLKYKTSDLAIAFVVSVTTLATILLLLFLKSTSKSEKEIVYKATT
jgi:hypothetical protein